VKIQPQWVVTPGEQKQTIATIKRNSEGTKNAIDDAEIYLYSGDKEHEAIIPHMMKDGA
jgi:hypothetical protein